VAASDSKYRASRKLVRKRVRQILANRYLDLSSAQVSKLTDAVFDRRMSFDELRRSADRTVKASVNRALEANRNSSVANDASYINRGLPGIKTRIKTIYKNRGVNLPDAKVTELARAMLAGKVTFDRLRTRADNFAKTPTGDGRPPNDIEQENNMDDVQDEFDDIDSDADDIDEPSAFSYKQLAKAAFPFLPDALLDAFAEGWSETGSPEGGLVTLRAHGQYETHFPGNKLEEGVFALAEADYVRYQQRTTDLLTEYQMGYNGEEIKQLVGQLVSGQTSIAEVEERVRKGYVAALQAPEEVRQELAEEFGIGIGDLAGFWLDPDEGVDRLYRRFTEAQIRGSSRLAGYGNLTAAEGARLADLGVDPLAARETFSELAASRGLFSNLVGTAESEITREKQLGGAFGTDAAAREEIQRKSAGRQAAFAGGGGAAQSQTGVTGLREAA
jgi:hypothetical protein